jgi:hypothetical protein
MFPTPAGGSIVPGTYVLTALDYYGSGLMIWERDTILLTTPDGGAGDGGGSGQSLQYDRVQETQAAGLVTWEGVLSTTGTGFTVVFSCPSGQREADGYTATSTTLLVMSQPLVYTYTKQ